MFESRILVKAIIANNMLSELQSVLTGFIDTLPMLKKLLSDRCSYKQEELVRGSLNKTYDAHNSLEDVKSLRDLLLHLKPQNAVLALHSFLYVCESIQHNHRMTTNFSSFKDLVSKKVLSKAMAKNIAGSGLSLQQMRLIHARGGYDGLHSVLSTKQRGRKSKCRVTASRKVLRTLSHHLSKE